MCKYRTEIQINMTEKCFLYYYYYLDVLTVCVLFLVVEEGRKGWHLLCCCCLLAVLPSYYYYLTLYQTYFSFLGISAMLIYTRNETNRRIMILFFNFPNERFSCVHFDFLLAFLWPKRVPGLLWLIMIEME